MAGKKPQGGTGRAGRDRAAGGRAIDFGSMSREERDEAISNLGPEDQIVLFHGTRDPETAARLVEEGFDPSVRPEDRVYRGRLAPGTGYFVSPFMMTSSSFGGYVVEFETAAKDLVGPPMKGIPEGESLDSFWRSVYPSSFRPGLSKGLSMGESQGLLVNRVPPSRVKRVWTWDGQAGKWTSQSGSSFRGGR